jgi:CrcB protein
MFKNILFVFIGGGTGSVLRYVCSLLEFKFFAEQTFPISTFLVNIVGCFIMGLFVGMFAQHEILDEKLRLLLAVGFCGGFTTFSAFGYENVRMLENGQYLLFSLYVGGSVIGGLLAAWGGRRIFLL